jgi:hypothetical protein
MTGRIEAKYVTSFLTPQTACSCRNPSGQGDFEFGRRRDTTADRTLIRRRRRWWPKLKIPAVAAAIGFGIGS